MLWHCLGKSWNKKMAAKINSRSLPSKWSWCSLGRPWWVALILSIFIFIFSKTSFSCSSCCRIWRCISSSINSAPLPNIIETWKTQPTFKRNQWKKSTLTERLTLLAPLSLHGYGKSSNYWIFVAGTLERQRWFHPTSDQPRLWARYILNT